MNPAAKGTILEKIALATKKRLEGRKGPMPLWELTEARLPHPFLQAFASHEPHYIAEIKRKSPSAGDLAPTADPVAVAGQYLASGATAISVLTETEYFNGSLEFLSQIRARYPQSLLLMKDFIIDEYQLFEGRIHGADAALLMASLLDQEELPRIYDFALTLGLTPLVEVHDEGELVRALDLGAALIGVNSRNLRTMEVSLDVARSLVKLVPKGKTLIAESGIRSGAEVRELYNLGYRGVLVGTSLMAGGAPGEALRRLKEEAK